MNTHTDREQEKSKSQSLDNGNIHSGGESTFQFVNNRPESVAQLKLQEVANNSPQVAQLRALQETANSSPQVKQALQLQVMADAYSTQQELIQRVEEDDEDFSHEAASATAQRKVIQRVQDN